MLRCGEELPGGTLFDQFPGVHDRDAVGDGGGVQVVGDQDESRSGTLAVAEQTREDVEDAAPGDRVEARR